MTRQRVFLIGLWALPLLIAGDAKAHDGPDPSDLPASVTEHLPWSSSRLP